MGDGNSRPLTGFCVGVVTAQYGVLILPDGTDELRGELGGEFAITESVRCAVNVRPVTIVLYKRSSG